jgi:superfamily II DNA or RNA helicase
MAIEKPENPETGLSNEQLLTLHQLQLLQWLESRKRTALSKGDSKAETAAGSEIVSDRWTLTRGVELYPWQIDCIRSWFDYGCRGTVKVVTGGGKTVLALAIAEKLQNERDPQLRIAIVVPTIVLMNQWYEEFEQRSNLPMSAVGRLGGGFSNSFEDGHKVLICVLASAYKLLPPLVNEQIGKHLLFIADECHRAGATEMSKVLAVLRAYSLGLSATPERDEDEEEEGSETVVYRDSQLGRALGDVVYDLTLAQAVELGIVPKFTIRHYGLALTGDEEQKYERLSRMIEEARKELQHSASPGRGSGLAFYRWVRSVSKKRGSRTNTLAGRFLMDTRERKDLLYRIKARHAAVEELLRQEFKNQPQSRAILFHESIDSVMELFESLRRAGFAVVAEHSDLPDSFREQSLELFRRGIANVVVSAKSLIEGFNVPAADVGIIVASSTSVRQRIQSLGRVLRRHRGPSGEEKTSIIHVLYARNTVDDAIYAKTDWEEFTGADRNEYFVWDPPEKPIPQEEPPRVPLPRDLEIDISQLRPGDVYEGQYEGTEYSCDMQGNIRDARGCYANNPGPIPEHVRSVKGTAGRFRLTPHRNIVLVRVPEGEDWTTRFVMVLDVPFDFSEGPPLGGRLDWSEHEKWLKQASSGDEYPFQQIDTRMKLNFRQRRGGVISKRIPNGEAYARVASEAADIVKGEDAKHLLEACKRLQARGLFSSQFAINSMNDAVFRNGGKLLFLSHLESGLEFPASPHE